jgi:hypothetical protein
LPAWNSAVRLGVFAGLLLAAASLCVEAAAARPAPALPPPTGTIVNVSTEPQLQAAVAGLTSNTTFALLAVISVVGSALGMLGALVFFYRKTVTPLAGLKRDIDQLLAGKRDVQLGFQNETTEVGDIARSLELYRKSADEVERQRWIKAQVAGISGELQLAADFPDFSRRLLSKLVPLVEGGMGAIYRMDPATDTLELMAGYGLDPSSGARASVKPGEGLVGQCAVERKAITLGNVPAGYVQLSSGLGAAAARMVSVVPVLSKDRVLAVLEIASFTELKETQRVLIEEVTLVVSLNLEILTRSLHTQELLGQSQEQARQLEGQHHVFDRGERGHEIESLEDVADITAA